MRSVVVIEAPGKKRTLEALLGKCGIEAEVFATGGHIFRSPPSLTPVGVDQEFRDRRLAEESVVRALRSASSGKEVFVATDPDQEGDVIARDVTLAIADTAVSVARVRISAFDLASVRSAFEMAAPICNSNHAGAGDARRVLDRLIGSAYRPFGRVSGALMGQLRSDPVIGVLRLVVSAKDDGRPFCAEVDIRPSNYSVWCERLKDWKEAGWQGCDTKTSETERLMPWTYGEYLDACLEEDAA